MAPPSAYAYDAKHAVLGKVTRDEARKVVRNQIIRDLVSHGKSLTRTYK